MQELETGISFGDRSQSKTYYAGVRQHEKEEEVEEEEEKG